MNYDWALPKVGEVLIALPKSSSRQSSHKCVTRLAFQLEVRLSKISMSLPVDTILGVAGVGVGLPGLVQVGAVWCDLLLYWMLT
jgi:hypothetical protein